MTTQNRRTSGLSRRSFLGSAAFTTAALAFHPRLTSFAQSGCERVQRIAQLWNSAVRPTLASRYHRLHHVLFHYVRNNWATLTPEQIAGIAEATWDGINGPNLTEHIAPSRVHATFVVRKSTDHQMLEVTTVSAG